MATRICISPCPNDTFLFESLVGKLLAEGGSVSFHDIAELNAFHSQAEGPDLIKVSCASAPLFLDRYRLLRCGGAFADAVGPLVLTGPAGGPPEVALPGRGTTAHLLWRKWAREQGMDQLVERFQRFDLIMPQLAAGAWSHGVVIHESRFTFADHGLSQVEDLGRYWHAKTGCPVPLGCVLGRADLGEAALGDLARNLTQGAREAMERPNPASAFVQSHAAELSEEVQVLHIRTYANARSLDCGEEGLQALRHLWSEAALVQESFPPRSMGILAGIGDSRLSPLDPESTRHHIPIAERMVRQNWSRREYIRADLYTTTTRPGLARKAVRSFRLRWSCWTLVVAVSLPVHAQEQIQKACLSVSPFRAVTTLKGSASPEQERDRVLEAWRRKGDSSWVIAAAGNCPDGLAVLDVFQRAEDVVSSPQGQSLRFHLEWRHLAGATDFFLPVARRALPEPAAVAGELQAAARQMFARMEIQTNPSALPFELRSGGGALSNLQSPGEFLVPPGPLSLVVHQGNFSRRLDTLLTPGSNLLLQVEFPTVRKILVQEDPQPVSTKRVTWPYWAATIASVAATVVVSWQEKSLHRTYDALGPTDSQEAFDASWREYRRANLLRNAGLGFTLVVAGSAAWMEWGRVH